MSRSKHPIDADGQPLAEIILGSVEDGIILVDSDGRIAVFNPAAGRITGVPPEQAVGQSWHEILKFVDRHGLKQPPDEDPVRRALQKGQRQRCQEAYILAPGQHRVPLHLIVTPLTAGRNPAAVCVMRDMSLEKEQEEARVDFVSTASHEMRTPLAALEGYLSLILEQPLETKTLQYAQKAHRNVVQLGQLFKNLLAAGQSEDGQLSHQPQTFVLNELLEQVIAENRAQAAIKDIKLEWQPAGTAVCQLHADPQRIRELLNNVLDNAVKYTDPGGQVRIALKKTEGFVQIKIEDSGLGVSPRDMPHLFQKFYRVSSSQPGIGLGLFICKKIVDLYDGDIWLESEAGRGSIFYINLPEHNPRATADDSASEGRPSSPS